MSGWWSRLFRHHNLVTAEVKVEQGPLEARLALYRTADNLPQVIVLTADDPLSLMDLLCKKALQASHERGGVIPLLALREIAENLLHAGFHDVVVSVLIDGSVVISDHGPGIADKEQALRPGFTTASTAFRRYIRGVGSGLCVAQESLRAIGGVLRIEDNLDGGTVVTLAVPQRHHTPIIPVAEPTVVPEPAVSEVAASAEAIAVAQVEPEPQTPPQAALAPGEGNPSQKSEYKSSRGKGGTRPHPRPRNAPATGGDASTPLSLTARQERLFQLFGELSEVGPSVAASEVGLSLASAYRELVALERLGLLEPAPGGKRRLTATGVEFLEDRAKR